MAVSPRTLYDIFFEDCTHYAKAVVNADGKVQYISEAGIPTIDEIQDHLDGTEVLGAYTVLPGNKVRWMAFDIDSKLGLEKAREIAKAISDFLKQHGILHVIEFSGNKGYHILIFFQEKESAADVKEAGEAIRDLLGFSKSGKVHVEVFPKQGSLKDGEIGNLLRLPLGFHPSSRKAAVFVGTDRWEEEPFDPEIFFDQKTTLQFLQDSITEEDPVEKIVNIMHPYWITGQRHDVTLCLSGYLANSGFTKDTVEEIITSIHTLVPDGELKDQLKAVETTFERHYNGESVLGLSGLSSILPANVLADLTKVVGKGNSSFIMQLIDRIRLEKGAPFLKVRQVAQESVNYFREYGRLVRDESDTYWLEQASHILTTVGNDSWARLIHNLLGLNAIESFGRQTIESLRHMTYTHAKDVKIKKRSAYERSENTLYINLGMPEVYVLKGEPDNWDVVYNGEIDILFKNDGDTLQVPDLKTADVDAISPWSFLTDDVNFKDTDDLTATQQKELLKALVCSFFFGELMPTRPILTILAASGSGKTTTARRILWLMEGWSEDVLGVVPDKPDSLRSSMAAHKVVVLDNLEKSKAVWLPDVLNRAATGSQVELRELHTTNRVKKLIFDLFVILTATEMPFSEETVYTRLLPIELGPIQSYRPENQIRADLINNFNAFWKGMLDDLNKVVAELAKNKTVSIPAETRLADFAVFCDQIKDVDFIDGKELMNGIGNLVNRQKKVLEENSPFVDVLVVLLKTHADEMEKWHGISELFSRGQRSAALNKQEWHWSNAQALSKHVLMLQAQLIKDYGMHVKEDKKGSRIVKLYKFEPTTMKMN